MSCAQGLGLGLDLGLGLGLGLYTSGYKTSKGEQRSNET